MKREAPKHRRVWGRGAQRHLLRAYKPKGTDALSAGASGATKTHQWLNTSISTQ